jgi:hypothetical protein
MNLAATDSCVETNICFINIKSMLCSRHMTVENTCKLKSVASLTIARLNKHIPVIRTTYEAGRELSQASSKKLLSSFNQV